MRMEAAAAKHEQGKRGNDIDGTQDEAEGAAEAADDFVGVGFLEVRVEHAQADGEAVQGESHDRYHGREEGDIRPDHVQQIAGEGDEAECDDQGQDAGEPVFGFDDALEAHGRHADDPQAAAFEGKLGEDEPGGDGSEVEGAGAEVQESDGIDPERTAELVGKVSKVDDVGAEQAEKHYGLPPLGGVAPEHAYIFHGEGAGVRGKTGQFAGHPFQPAGDMARIMPAPKPVFSRAAAPALHGGGGIVKEFAKPGEGDAAKKQGVAEEHGGKEDGLARDAFGPLQHGRGKPVAGEEREQGETGFGEQPVQRLQRPLVQQLVVHGIGFPPEGDEGEQNDREEHQHHLKIPAVQMPADDDGEPRTQHAWQHHEDADEHGGERIKMPGDVAHQPKGHEQRRDQKQKGPGGQHHRFDEFPAEDGFVAHRQGQQKGRLPVFEQIRVRDDEVAQQQQGKEKGKQRIEQAFREHRTQAGEFGHEFQSVIKQLKRQRQIGHEEQADDGGEQAGLFADRQQPPPAVDEVHPQQQQEQR